MIPSWLLSTKAQHQSMQISGRGQIIPNGKPVLINIRLTDNANQVISPEGDKSTYSSIAYVKELDNLKINDVIQLVDEAKQYIVVSFSKYRNAAGRVCYTKLFLQLKDA